MASSLLQKRLLAPAVLHRGWCGLASTPSLINSSLTTAPRALSALLSPCTPSTPTLSLSATPTGVRTYKTIPRRVIKARRKSAAKELRVMLKYAERYDPMRKCRMTLRQTIRMMGWPHIRDFLVTEGVYVDLILEHKYIAFHVIPKGSYSVTQSEETDEATGQSRTKRYILPETPELNEKLEICHTKGWKVVWVPEDLWLGACDARKQHKARHDLLLDLVLDMEPFEDRYVL